MKHGQRVPSSTGKNNRLRMVLSSTALVSTLAVATWGTAQEAVPVSGDQFGYGQKAVAETELAMETIVSVRDKVIAAYQQIMQMPI